MVTDRAMRASDQDREHVVEILQAQYAEGRLTLEEFDERMASAYAGKTWGDLADLTKDLPVDTRFGAGLATTQNQPPPGQPHGPAAPRWIWPLVPLLIAAAVLAAMPSGGMTDGRHHHLNGSHPGALIPVLLLVIFFFVLRRAAIRHRRGRRGPFV